MIKKVSRRMLVNEIQKLMQDNLLMSKNYLELLSEVKINSEGADCAKESNIINCACVMLTGKMVQLKRAVKKYQKHFPND